MIQDNRIKHIEDLIIVYLLIACSGIPIFVASYYLMPLSFLYTIFVFLKRGGQLIDKNLVWILGFMLALTTLRYISNSFTLPPIYEVLVIILKYSFPFIVLKILRERFTYYYIQVMYFISVISIFFFTFFLLFPNMEYFFKDNIAPFFRTLSKSGFYEYAPNFILYTINQAGRNHGPFWEAGGFGVFLVIALLFHLFLKKSLFDKQGIVLLIAASTTFSTATYAAMFIIIIAYIFIIRDYRYKFLLLPLTILLFYNIYLSSEFLKGKVEKQLSVAETEYRGRVANRFTSILIDLDRIISKPLFGNTGRYIEKDYTIYDHRNNGLSSMAVSHGLIYFFLFFILTYRSFVKISKYNGSYRLAIINLSLLAILAVYFGQTLTDKPMLNILFMFPFVYFSQMKTNTLLKSRQSINEQYK